MSWNILEVVVYKDDQPNGRVVRFKPGEVNIITGASHKGKTALLDIVDYCLGSDYCTVSSGVVRDNATWFGLKLKLQDREFFIAREAPPAQQSSKKVMILEGKELITPTRNELRQTTNIDDATKELSRLLGIAPHKADIEENATRSRLQATIRHATSFAFQPQYVIASPAVLFDNTEDSFKQKALIDTFPYFLGAIGNDHLAFEEELERAQRDVKRAERRLADAERIAGQGFEKAKALIEEAKQVGFQITIRENASLPELIAAFRSIKGISTEDGPGIPEDRLESLQIRFQELQSQINTLVRRIRAAEDFQRQAADYNSEIQRQLTRLETIDILPAVAEQERRCPVCEQTVNHISPTEVSIRHTIERLQGSLMSAGRERPQLHEHIRQLQEQKEAFQQELTAIKTSIDQLIAQSEEARILKQRNERQAHVLGRISMYLDGVESLDDVSPLREALRQAKDRVTELEKMLGQTEKKNRIQAALDRISQEMTSLGRSLDLEFQGVPLRLDIERLTIKVQRQGRPLTLAEIGSGANWVGYHIVTLLALHKFFLAENRPVPAFLMLDQPSQVYYPPDPADRDKGDIAKAVLRNEDRQSLRAMYQLLLKVVAESKGRLQIIVTDHANFRDDETFQKSIQEEWRDGNDPGALIPQNWLSKSNQIVE